MKEICCHTCAYLIVMDPDKSRLFEDRWGCDYHKLYDGEVSDTRWQSCDSHITSIAKVREDKLKELGIV